MPLDVPTLMVMGGFVAACAGAILVGSWWLNENPRALLLWGAGSLLACFGILSLVSGMQWQEPVLFGAGDIAMALAHGLMWMGARAYDGKPASRALLLPGPLLLVLAGGVLSQNTIAGLGLVVNACYLFAAAFAFWRAAQPSLPARWPMILFILLHAVVMLLGAVNLYNGAEHQVPPLLSIFGIVHFESILFSIGTAMCLVALVKGRSEAVARHNADIDSLTGIANRAAFMASAERVLARCRQDGTPVSVVMFDLDRFKAINDTYGHAIGDAVIQKFCEVAGVALRPHDVLGRIGGEEFAVVLPRTSIEPAAMRADRIRAAFADECHVVKAMQVEATVSCGVAMSENGEARLSAMLEQADEALYRAKAAGRNCVKRAGQAANETKLAVVRVA
jgi:diguanylate cyclase (GGDEF)-like protein